ncbi:MAG: 6-bladed beta-propeller, partial [Tannerellaceae bacterium]
DESLFSSFATFGMDGDFFIFPRREPSSILRFSKNGKYLNKIGAVGNGPGEYAELTDICVDPVTKTISLLGASEIYKYNYDGSFIDKRSTPFPAFSFCIDTDGNYWFYSGNNKTYNPDKLKKFDAAMKPLDQRLPADETILPWGFDNLKKNGAITTFVEGFNDTVYQIKDGEIAKAYAINFKDLALDKSAFPADPMDLIPFLRSKHYASIKNYLENDNYAYFQIAEYPPAPSKNIGIYHWIFDKAANKNLLIKQDDEALQQSYLTAPQILTADNQLYFLGYLPDSDLAAQDNNPSIISIDLSKINFN